MPASPAILAIDLGTQSLRLSLVAADGTKPWTWSRPVATRTRGEVSEQDTEEWDALLREGMDEARRVSLRYDGVAAAGPLAGWVPHDRSGRAIGPALMYFDRRTAPDLARLEALEGLRADGLRSTIADPVPHLLRLRRQEPEIDARTHRLLDATGHLVARLTGGIATLDAYTALRLPDEALARAPGVDVARLGRPTRIGEFIGPLAPEFGAGAPVVAAAFDSKCAYIASGISRPGEALDISGTVTSFGVVAAARLVDLRRRIYAVPLDDAWLARGSMGGTGSILEWARGDLPFEAYEALAASAEPGARGVTFLPFHSGARAPLWMPSARGAFLGLSLDSGPAEMARAVFEGLALGLRHVVETMEECGAPVDELRLAGGLARSTLLARLKADILGRPVVRCADHELTTLGLAVIALAAIGAFPSRVAASRHLVRAGDRIAPAPAVATGYALAYRRYVAATDALTPVFAAGGAPSDMEQAVRADPRSEFIDIVDRNHR
jgi:xylulokinase